MKRAISILILATLPSVVLADGDHDAGIGRPGDPAKVERTVEVLTEDNMRFVPNRIEVKPGETIRFIVKNVGKLTHEMVLGTPSELKEHAEMMRKMPGMKHAEPNMISLKPGQRGSIVWQFGGPGKVEFACPQPGHIEAGMTGVVEAKE